MKKILALIGLLVCSNTFMNVAWYGHLKFKDKPVIAMIFASWGIAFFEYCFQVPANRIGSGALSVTQLKVIQEVITLITFCLPSSRSRKTDDESRNRLSLLNWSRILRDKEVKQLNKPPKTQHPTPSPVGMFKRMKIGLGSDHAGFELKEYLAKRITALGHEVVDLGAYQYEPLDDYPDFAERVGMAVVEGKADRGVLVCGSGIGASVAANKIVGVRAGLCTDTYSAHQGV